MQRLRRIQKTRRHAGAVKRASELLHDMRRLAHAAENQFSTAGDGLLDRAHYGDKIGIECLRRRSQGLGFETDAVTGT